MDKSQEIITKKDSTTDLPIPRDSIREVLRLISAKQNCLTEIYPDPVFIGLSDIDELNRSLDEKLSKLSVVYSRFHAIVAFTNYRSIEFHDRLQFKNAIWTIPEITESLTLKWELWLQCEGVKEPLPFNVTLRCAPTINPAIFIQYVFSKEDEDMDKLALARAFTSCRIDFSDAVIGQELLDLVARWHKARRKPEANVPGIDFLQKHARIILGSISTAIPPFTFVAVLSYLYYSVVGIDGATIITNAFLAKSLIITCCAMASIQLTGFFNKRFKTFLEKLISQIGRLHMLELTNGDRNRQTRLAGKAQKSFIVFLLSGIIAITWNIIAAYVAITLFNIR